MEINDKLISFIICVNDESLYEECKRYIKELKIPEGYSIEIIKITDARSMTSGYNKGIHKALGKYKIYMHQDVFILNKNILDDILYIFSNKNIGVIGLVGSKGIPDSAIWWEDNEVYGSVYDNHNGVMDKLEFRNPQGYIEEVSLIDGLIMITQYDVPWREDIFQGWHFYDASQCIEFTKNNFKIVVPKQLDPWILHDCGIVSVNGYDYYRNKFISEYIDK
ncbi:glycosyltransferase family protein [Clostridium sp.]|uniref:glycosyltransferase family protein n=1 Tax=Clostridium sp. TaxID=1506 RepID=UPI003464D716